MKKTAIYLGILQSFVAILAIPSGYLLMKLPDGSGIGLSLSLLENSPFDNYFIPGLFLFIGNGILHLIGAIFSFKKKHLTGLFGILLGVFLMLWIIIQVYYTKGMVHFLQPLFLIIGLIEINMAWAIFKGNR